MVMSNAPGVPTSTTLESLVAVLSHLRDPIGILSVYVGVDPSAQTTPRPAWEITLDDALASVRRTMREEGPHERWASLDRRLQELEPELSRLVGTAEHGRGRGLFAGIDSGEVHGITVQTGFPTRVSLGAVAHLIPLLAVDEGAPMGLIVVGRHTVRVLEARVGEVAEITSFDVEPVVVDGAERKGPARSNPMRAQHMVAQRDRYARHLEADHSRRLGSAADAVSRLAVERGWQVAAVSADPRGGDPVADGLRTAGIEVEYVDRDLIELPAAQAFAELAPGLDAARRRRDLALVRRIRDEALSGGPGALGVVGALAALADGRVDRLVVDGGRDIPGSVGADGELRPYDATTSTFEPLFGDHMAIRAIESGSSVSVVDGGAAEALADADGVAALLRW
jgi:Bacterial archaeo-eukaryotic release factor family 10